MSTSYPPKCRCTRSARKRTAFFRHCGISAFERYRSVVPSTVDSHVQYIKPQPEGWCPEGWFVDAAKQVAGMGLNCIASHGLLPLKSTSHAVFNAAACRQLLSPSFGLRCYRRDAYDRGARRDGSIRQGIAG